MSPADEPTEVLPLPTWKPTLPVDHDRVAEAFARYTGKRFPFAVFEHGTCVPVQPGSQDVQQDALAILDRLVKQPPAFGMRRMGDGNFLVSYSDKAYTVCFADQVNPNFAYIDANHMDGITPAEVLMMKSGQPAFDRNTKIGLFGRAYWFLDAQHPVVNRIVV